MYKPGDLFISRLDGSYRFLCLYLGPDENKPGDEKFFVIRDNFNLPCWQIRSKPREWFMKYTQIILN